MELTSVLDLNILGMFDLGKSLRDGFFGILYILTVLPLLTVLSLFELIFNYFIGLKVLKDLTDNFNFFHGNTPFTKLTTLFLWLAVGVSSLVVLTFFMKYAFGTETKGLIHFIKGFFKYLFFLFLIPILFLVVTIAVQDLIGLVSGDAKDFTDLVYQSGYEEGHKGETKFPNVPN
jgi:hypothetical protein